MDGKVFGIGLPRCAGQTLQMVLTTLLGRCMHSPGRDLLAYEQWPAAVEVFRHPERLREDYPGCKLILNWRAEEPWLASCERVYNRSMHWNHPIWDYPLCDFAAYRDWYLSERMDLACESCLLVWDITAQPCWKIPCEFLGLPVPDEPFPNVDRYRVKEAVYG